jgi:myo-inositol 2-dehydrogenase/D-chiro-inositol 1-dehydrogenase
MEKSSRRNFIKTTSKIIVGSIAFPMIVRASIFRTYTPNDLINIGVIGTGRIARSRDIPGLIKQNQCRIIGVCDVDSKRLQEGKNLVEESYAKKFGTSYYSGVTSYKNYQDLLNNREIDAAIICTPDHWHAKPTIDTVKAGKDVYLEKQMSLTIEEGRKISDAVNKTNRIFQIGSQYRSIEDYRMGCELIRNGRIGKLEKVDVRMPVDPPGGNPIKMPVPKNLNYEMWLGSTPLVYYTEDRVHPQTNYERPGWLRCEQFGSGMITGWGAHLFDIVQWAMDTEDTGPIEIFSEAEFPTKGLWNVHGNFDSRMVYKNGIIVTAGQESKDNPSGVKFIGTEGWLFIAVGGQPVTSSDPSATRLGKTLWASDKKILSPIKENEIHLYVSNDHHANWLDSIRSKQPAVSTAEIAHRTCTVCLLQHISMKLHRKLYWDPQLEKFINDKEANSMISRPQRKPYNID